MYVFSSLIDFTDLGYFCLYGVLAVILWFIPNLIFAKKEHQAKVDDIDTCNTQICFLEIIGRLGFFVAVFLWQQPIVAPIFLYLAAAVLLLYYLAWAKYYKDGAYYPDIYTKAFLFVPTPIATFTALYYVLIALWLNNIIALCFALVFGVCHLANSEKARRDLVTRCYE